MYGHLPSRVRGSISGALLVTCLWAASGQAAEPRPYIFSMGHFLAGWANQPWTYDIQAYDEMVEMGATGVWIDLPWSSMESSPGQIDWSYADHQVNEAVARGLTPFAFVGTTPTWARLYDLPNHRTPPADEYLPQFNAFHSALAARYRGKVTYYQFWNEPSGCGWVNENCSNGHDCALFTIWQQRAYDALKAGNPDCVVAAGGLDGDPAGYVQCMYSHGGRTGFDAIAIHPYAPGGSGGPGTGGQGIDYGDLTEVRDVMVANGDSAKKIWITEYGWNTTDESRRSEDLNEVLTELKKPQYDYLFCAKHLVLNDWSGTDFCCWGLTDSWFNPKPAFYTFKDFDKSFPQSADFTADVTFGRPPLTVHFTDTSAVVGAYAWQWDFGDGSTGTQQHPVHTYAAGGAYTVRLTVTGMYGAATVEKPAFIRAGVVTEILNPSFEDLGDYLAGWSKCLRSQSSLKHNPTTHIPTPRFHDGVSSVGMSSDRAGDGVGEGALWQEVAVVPGRTYRVSFWAVLTTTDDEYADDFVELRVRDGSAGPLSCANDGAGITDNSTMLAHLPGATGQWRELAGDFTPAEGVITIVGYWDFNGTTQVINSLHIDDWRIQDVSPPVPGDFDSDTDVDGADVARFNVCATGPEMGPPAAGCEPADLDHDGDVDQSDFGSLQRCFSGMHVPGLPSCAAAE